jgi:RNA polymerase sigma-70 factor (ECF subfamily)
VGNGARNFRDVGAKVEPVIVNGAPGLVVRYPARSFLAAFTVANGRIVEIDLIADPDKLRGLSLD